MNNKTQSIHLKASRINSETRSKFYLTGWQIDTFSTLLRRQFQIEKPVVIQSWDLIALSFEHPENITEQVFDYWMAFKQIWPTPYLRKQVEYTTYPLRMETDVPKGYSSDIKPSLEELTFKFCQKIIPSHTIQETAIHIIYDTPFGEKLIQTFTKNGFIPKPIQKAATLQNGYWSKQSSPCQLILTCLKEQHHLIDKTYLNKFKGAHLTLLDLGMPCNISPSVQELSSVSLFNLDSIASLLPHKKTGSNT